MSDYHIPVLLDEAIDFLNVSPGYWYIDCNLGGGGHTEEILIKGGYVLGIDLDKDAIIEVSQKLKDYIADKRLILCQSNFSKIDEVINNLKLEKIKGVLFDLGVSSHQLEMGERGFSINYDAPLDMRMDNRGSVKAVDLVNALHEGELTELLTKLGEEGFARKIAKAIVTYRGRKVIETTNELAQIIASVKPRSFKEKIHPATKTFQALRIAVNDELNSLREALPKAFEALSPGGRLVVISFHSLEDRIVKTTFQDLVKEKGATLLTKKPFTPSGKELVENPRSRSAKMRVIEKV